MPIPKATMVHGSESFLYGKHRFQKTLERFGARWRQALFKYSALNSTLFHSLGHLDAYTSSQQWLDYHNDPGYSLRLHPQSKTPWYHSCTKRIYSVYSGLPSCSQRGLQPILCSLTLFRHKTRHKSTKLACSNMQD